MRKLPPLLAALLLAACARASTNFAPLPDGFAGAAKSAAGVTLRWPGRPGLGAVHDVERAGAVAGPWTVAPDGGALATNAYTDPGDAAARFFRLRPQLLPAARGRVLGAAAVRTYSTFEQQIIFQFAGIPVTPQRAVTVHRVLYETVSQWGGRTHASGALAVPDGATHPLPLVSYQHGTVLERTNVPSRLSLEILAGVAFATAGYAAALPDYLGLGDSPGFHPYHHAKSAATCVVDLLRAARAFAATNGAALDGKVFLTGYSQGGHATLAAQREIEALHADEFALAAVAAGAGAYDLSGLTADGYLTDAAPPNPYYLPYLLTAYVDVYFLADSPARYLAAPYDATLPPLFDGTHGDAAINAAMPARARDVLAPGFLESLETSPANVLRVKLRENDLLDWTPRTPLRLYHCAGDWDVPPGNAAAALAAFQARGATNVTVIDPLPAAGHGDCAIPTLAAAKAWFDGLR